jgi:hypothetical protein
MRRLDGRVALVTGATRGVGEAIARRLFTGVRALSSSAASTNDSPSSDSGEHRGNHDPPSSHCLPRPRRGSGPLRIPLRGAFREDRCGRRLDDRVRVAVASDAGLELTFPLPGTTALIAADITSWLEKHGEGI